MRAAIITISTSLSEGRGEDESGPALAQQSPKEPAFTTDVYQGQMQGAQADIDRIIHENAARTGSDVAAK